MTSIPAAGYFTNGSRTNAEAKTAQDDMLQIMRESPGGATPTTLTLAGGAVTPTQMSHLIDTQSAASSDDLDNIVVTNTPDGRLLMIYAANATHTVVVRHAQGGSGQITTLDGLSVSLDDTTDGMLLELVGTTWFERIRLGNIATTNDTQTLINKTLTSPVLTSPSVTTGDLAIANNIEHIGDTDTQILFTTDDIGFNTGGTERAAVSDSGFNLESGIAVTSILDEDTMVSDLATALSSQQAIKAYVDTAVSDASFESGTDCLFWQTAAPTGWTRNVVSTYNDAALRVMTSGTWVANTVGVAFATRMATGQVSSFTAPAVASHTHPMPYNENNVGSGVVTGATGTKDGTIATEATGPGSSHQHTTDISIHHVDIIIASKDV